MGSHMQVSAASPTPHRSASMSIHTGSRSAVTGGIHRLIGGPPAPTTWSSASVSSQDRGRSRSLGSYALPSCCSFGDLPSSRNNHTSWPDPPKKWPVDTRYPRYHTQVPSYCGAVREDGGEGRSGTPEPPADGGQSDPSCSCRAQERRHRSTSAQKKNDSPFQSQSCARRREEDSTSDRVGYFNGRPMRVDEDGWPLCLWEGAFGIDWGTPKSWGQVEQELMVWRKRRFSCRGTPAEVAPDRHCSERADATYLQEGRRRFNTKMKAFFHDCRHRLMGGCKAQSCCLDRELGQRQA